MGELFRNVLHASFQGGIVILAVILLRLLLKKAPKRYICLLWILAGLRLLMPFSIESSLSLQPDMDQIIQARTEPDAQIQEIEMTPAVPENAGMPEDAVAVYGDAFANSDPDQVWEQHVVIDWQATAAWTWSGVACAMGVYSAASYLLLKRRVREAIRTEDGVYECSGLETAFILGFFGAKIYIPMGLPEENRQFILKHERTHLKRFDHWVKLIGFIALAIHWFNPLVWAAYLLLCRDIELACDERVVRDMGLQQRKAYSAALLACSVNHRSIAACPVAFGEVSVKQRIKSVLSYRKPAFWVSVVAVIALAFVAVCFLTDPAAKEPDLSFLNYKNAIPLAAEQDVLFAVHYGEDEQEDGEVAGSIGIGMAEGEDLAAYLESARWTEKWFEPSDKSSPGSVAFNITDDLRITVYDRRFAAVEYGEEVRYYRISGSDYQAAVEMLLPPDNERLEQSSRDVIDGSMIGTTVQSPDEPDWGISASVSDVTPSGLNYHVTQSDDSLPMEFYYGRPYDLERWTGSEWEAVEPIIDNGAFTMEAIRLPKNETTTMAIRWAWLYGELPEGTYRIGKNISNEVIRKIGVDITIADAEAEEGNYTYYAVFEIGGESETG